MDYIGVVLVCSLLFLLQLLLLPQLLFVHVFLSLIKILCWQFAIVAARVVTFAVAVAPAPALAVAYM